MTRQQINDYATAAIAILIMAALYLYTTTKDAPKTELHKQAVQQTQTQTKEVRQNADAIHILQKQHDQQIIRRVQEAENSVPDDIDTLIHLANTIIRDSNENRR